MILIVTSKRDGHITKVAQLLADAGKAFIRLNTEDFVGNSTVIIDPVAGNGTIFLKDSRQLINISEIDVVWYRKPDPLILSHFDLDQAGLNYVEAECGELLQGLWALLKDAHWVNNPLTTRMAHRKLLQLKTANDLGFITPKTIVTNDAAAAFSFCQALNWQVAIKSLGAIAVTIQAEGEDDKTVLEYGIFTRKIDRAELVQLEHTIANMPSVFQEYIDKEYELRITVVGRRVFSCRIYSQEQAETREDCRINIRSARHEWVQGSEIEGLILSYMDAFGLNFGCFDVGVRSSGDNVFFECNPNGQWLWVEEMTGAPISQAVFELLTNPLVGNSKGVA